MNAANVFKYASELVDLRSRRCELDVKATGCLRGEITFNFKAMMDWNQAHAKEPFGGLDHSLELKINRVIVEHYAPRVAELENWIREESEIKLIPQTGAAFE